jgi:hypothetical protein
MAKTGNSLWPAAIFTGRGIVSMNQREPDQKSHDADAAKGAVESDSRTRQHTNTTMEGQLPHRTESRMVKANDSDFPEPGSNPEHSGQRVEEQPPRSPERDTVDQDPGERQKRNQDEKDDPLAA